VLLMSKFAQVVIGSTGILFLLAVILFPVFDHVISKSPIASCQSNIAQLALALVQYSQDSDNTLPSATTADGHGWREAIYPYVQSPGVYRCPDDKRNGSQDSPGNLPKSYDANYLGLDANHRERGLFANSHQPPASLNWKTLADPAQTISLVDARGGNGEEWNMTSPTFLPSSGRELFAHVPRHLFYEHLVGTLNCLFADGHVKAMQPDATLTPINLWTRDNAPFTGGDLQNAQAILKHAENE
jgi:prepilin-type processing-associated H-X9-DG protein